MPVYATGEQDGTHFYAMELIDGPSLDQVIGQLRAAASTNGPTSKMSSPKDSPLGLDQTGPYVAGSSVSNAAVAPSSSALDSGSGYFGNFGLFLREYFRLPTSAGQFATLASGDATKILTLVLFLIATIGVIAFVVLLNEGQRNIPVSYAKRTRGDRVYAGVDTHLPLRVITAGVIPIIFALAFLSVPGLLGQVLSSAKTAWVANIAKEVVTLFSPTGTVYAVSYFVLVVAFTFFYTSVVFNPKNINLQKQGGFIPGIRPGNQTASYLKRVINRITLGGAIGLGIIAVLPFIASSITNSQVLTFGGTSLIIVVSVAIETLKQLEAQAITTSYEQY